MALPDVPPFTKLLGVNVLHRSPERTEAELPVREDLCNRRGVLHGGAVMALGDTLGGLTASASLTPDGRTATIESKTNFFAAGEHQRQHHDHEHGAGDPSPRRG